MKFFPQEGHDCFRAALANLFVVYGDKDTAHKVYDAYDLHPTTHGGLGVLCGAAPRLVTELTSGRYDARYTGRFKDGWLERLVTHHVWRHQVPLIKEECAQGRVREASETGDFTRPAIVILNGEELHALVDVKEFKDYIMFVNGTDVLLSRYEYLPLVGVLEVWPSQS